MTEREIGDGIFAAEENNDDNSVRGTFIDNLDSNGGRMTLGASSSEIVINIDATEVRADGPASSLGDGQVTLGANDTAYPRQDLIIAFAGTQGGNGRYNARAGEPIDEDTMQTLVADGVVGGGQDQPVGYPIDDPRTIPEVQPNPGTGLRDAGAVLGMAWVPPSTTDSTDMEPRFLTDLRAEGVSFSDVLRSGDAIDEIESADETIDATVADSEAFGGLSYAEYQRRQAGVMVHGENVDPGGSVRKLVYVPDGYVLRIWGLGVVGPGGAQAGSTARVVNTTGDANNVVENDAWATGNGDNTYAGRGADGNQTFALVALNGTSNTTAITARFAFTVEPADDFGGR